MSIDDMFRDEFARLELEGRMESRAKLAEPALRIPQQRHAAIMPDVPVLCCGFPMRKLSQYQWQCSLCGGITTA